VWAQFGSFRSYHPALVIKGSLVNLATPDSTQAFVFWFSDRKVSAVSAGQSGQVSSHQSVIQFIHVPIEGL